MVGRGPSLGMPVRHAAWPPMADCKSQNNPPAAGFLRRVPQSPRADRVVLRTKPHVRRADEHHHAEGKRSECCEPDVPCFGRTIGPVWAGSFREPHFRQTEAKPWQGVRGRQPIPFGIGEPIQRCSRCPPHGQVVHHDSLRRSEEHTTQGVLGEAKVSQRSRRRGHAPLQVGVRAKSPAGSSPWLSTNLHRLDAPYCLRGNAIHREKWQFERRGVSSSAKTRLAQEVPRIRRSNVSMRRRHHGHCPAWPVPSPARLPRFPELTGDSIPLNLAVSPMVDFDGFSIGFGHHHPQRRGLGSGELVLFRQP